MGNKNRFLDSVARIIVFSNLALFFLPHGELPAFAQTPNIDVRPADADNLERMARNNPHKALDILHDRLIREPDNPYLLFTTGSLELEMEQTKLSAKRFEHYLALSPKSQNAVAYNRLAYSYMLMQLPMKALAVYNHALSIVPTSGALYCERGCLYSTLRQPDKSLIDLNKAVLLEPKNRHFVLERAQYFAKNNKFQEAANDYSSVLKLGGETALIYAKRAEVYKKMNRPDLAKKDMDQVNQFSMEMLDDSK